MTFTTWQTRISFGDAEDIGKKLTVYGIVKVKDGQAYIEAEISYSQPVESNVVIEYLAKRWAK